MFLFFSFLVLFVSSYGVFCERAAQDCKIDSKFLWMESVVHKPINNTDVCKLYKALACPVPCERGGGGGGGAVWGFQWSMVDVGK